MNRRLGVRVVALLALFLLTSQSLAQSQPQGQVLTLGYQNVYRPDCWTPLVIAIRPGSTKSDKYQIQVKQEDLDRDHPIFVRTIPLTGNAENGVRDQKFWMYFKPQPTSDGLPSAASDLQDLLQVSLHNGEGKWLSALPNTMSVITNIDVPTQMGEPHRDTRLVLAVANGSGPTWNDYKDAYGILENVIMVKVTPDDLPESVLGYDAIDAVVWLNSDPADLKADKGERFRALESYVRRGGTLVICTPTDWQKMLALGDLLPVSITGNQSSDEVGPLRRIARQAPFISGLNESRIDGWDNLAGEHFVAVSSPKPGARVIETMNLPKSSQPQPWLVRMPMGAGEITWIAQDLSGEQFQHTDHWPRIWDYILDLHNKTFTPTVEVSDTAKDQFRAAPAVDVGYALLQGLELSSKSWWLITLAVVFFIGYWLVAGPGMYAYLVAKHRASFSWFLFCASALVATAITVLVVKMTLRGAPEMQHLSLVRAAAGQPANIYSRFGLYIPRDGMQQIELKEMAPQTLATISAFAIHPQHLDNSNVPEDPGPEYEVAVRDDTSDEPASIRVPYRTTLKKFEADWTGNIAGRVEGSGKLRDTGEISGTLTNGTGVRLRNVYIAYFQPQVGHEPGAGEDIIFYMPVWDPGTSIDLEKKFQPHNDKGQAMRPANFAADDAPQPGRDVEFRGSIRDYWEPYWTSLMKPGLVGGDSGYNDQNSMGSARASVPVLSFFSRLAPLQNLVGASQTRYELRRRGGRKYDVSAALSAGGLVVVAESQESVAIPIPLEVEGERINGKGSTVYQFVLPIDSSAIAPTTEPAATQASTTEPTVN